MERASFEGLLGPEAAERLRRPIETARPLPGAAYASEAYFRLELERVLRRRWIGIAFAHQVPSPGDAIPVIAAGLPAIVLRDREGEIRVFHNVCRHRGSVVLTEPARGRPTLRCPYHGWAYGLDGGLVAAPLFEGKRKGFPASLERTGCGLAPIRSGIALDTVFVNVSGDAPPLESAIAPFTELTAPYAMERFQLAHHEGGEISANWKLAVEAAVENYHEEFVHQNLPARIDASGARTFSDCFEGEVFGFTFAGETALRSPTPLVPFRTNATEGARTDHLCFLFPNTQLSLFGSLAVRTLWTPIAVDRTHWQTSWYLVDSSATDDAHAEARTEMIRYWRQLREEDKRVLTLMQQGRQSPVADDLRLSPFWEGSILHFHRKLVDAMTADAG